jgi:uncharacterized protein YdaU (DUF1376 family)
VNYYQHHIGDYAEATLHLTFVEDAAYSRCIRKYYSTEKPLPTDLKQVQRLVGARTKEEKSAVATVLEEFFILESDGWHNKRCDFDLAQFIDGEPEREVKKANEENRVKRHREERASLFKTLTDAGQHAPWNIGIGELRAMVERLQNGNPATPDVPLPATAPATPATATQAPIPNTHTPIPKLTSKASSGGGSTVSDSAQAPRVAPPPPVREKPPLSDDPAVLMSATLRRLGVDDALFTHPAVMAWTEQGVPDAILEAAVTTARSRKGPNGKIPANYLLGIVHDLLNPNAMPATTGTTAPRAWQASAKGIERKGKAMGLTMHPGELHRDYAARIQAEIENREGATP